MRRPRTPRKQGRVEVYDHATSAYLGAGQRRITSAIKVQVGVDGNGAPVYALAATGVVLMDDGRRIDAAHVYVRPVEPPWRHKQNRVEQRKLDVVHNEWVAEETINADVSGWFR